MSSLPIYEGGQPYVFISYAHANSPAVMQVVEALQEKGFRVWYDDGIEVGSEWPEYIAQHLANAGVMVAFLSNAYMRSDNCRKEMHYALTKRIPIVNIFMEQTQMTPGMEMQVGNLFALMKYTMRDDVFYEKLFAAPQLDAGLLASESAAVKKPRKRRAKKVPVDLTVEARKQKRRRTRRLIRLALLGVLLIACVVLGIIGYSTGLLQRVRIGRQQTEISALPGDTAVTMKNAALEEAVRGRTGKAERPLSVSDLVGITALSFSGEGVSFNGEEAVSAQWPADAWKDLSDLQYFPSLMQVSFSGVSLSSLETLPACGIESLTLTDVPLTSLKGIGALSRLREVESAGTHLTELGDIGLCLQLRRMSLQDSNIADFSPVRPLTKLAEVELSHCGINDLRPIMRLSSLSDIALTDCDLRGGFFKAFDRERSLISLKLSDCDLNSTANLNDFTGLTTLTLVRTGEKLDWSALAALPALKTVTADESMEAVLRPVLDGTGIELLPAQ